MSKKVRTKRLLALSAAVAGLGSLSTPNAQAAAPTLTWDASGNGTALDGAGSWGTTTPANWYNGSDVNWNFNDVAVFGNGGTPGVVTLGNVTASGLVFNSASSSYTLSSGSLTLLTGPITINNNTLVNSPVFLSGALSFSGSSNSKVLTVAGAVTRNVGSAADFNITNGTYNGAGLLNAVTTTVQGWATVNGTDWAVASGGQIAALSSYTNSTAGTTAPGATTNVDFQASNTTTWANQSINSLRFNTAAANTLTLGSTGTLTVTSGGILVTPNVGSSNLSTITGGTLLGASGKDLVVIQNNAPGTLQISSVIANNTTATGLTKSGAGALVLTASNTFTGNTTVNAGTLQLLKVGSIATASTVSVGSGSTFAANLTNSNNVTLNGGTLLAFGDNVGSGGSITVSGSTVYHTFTSTGANTLLLPSSVTANELLVGGGGAGGDGVPGQFFGAGGGGGQVKTFSSQALTSGSLTILVGAGGAAGSSDAGLNGRSTTIGSNVAVGGLGAAGLGVGGASGSGKTGASGNGSNYAGGGAGDTSNGSTGSGSTGGAGGAGTAVSSSFDLVGATYGGGGGGGSSTGGAGGAGGGGAYANAGTANTGGGGGGNRGGGAGVAVVSYAYAVGVADPVFNGNITVNNTSTLDAYGAGGIITLNGGLSGTGGVNISSSNGSGGAVVFDTAAKAYTGVTTINSGAKLTVTTAGAITGSSTVTVNSGGVLNLSQTSNSNTLSLSGGTVNLSIGNNVGSGGNISQNGNTVYHTFLSSGSLVIPNSVTGANELIVGGGGGGNAGTSSTFWPGGGGGGQVLTLSNMTLGSGSTGVTIGAGGFASSTSSVGGGAGGFSQIGSGRQAAGGSGAPSGNNHGGASGGSSGNSNTTNAGGAPSAVVVASGGGGGGSFTAGNGYTAGIGTAVSSTFDNAGGVYGGGGGGWNTTFNGSGEEPGGIGGGGGNGGTVFGTPNTGGGGGGGFSAADIGGSGIVVISYAIALVNTTTTLGGPINVAATSTLDAISNLGQINVSGAMTGAGGINITSSLATGGIVNYSNTQAYNGDTTVDAGATLQAGIANALPNGAGKGNLVVPGTFDTNGFNVSINALKDGGVSTGIVTDNASSTTPTLTLGYNNASGTFSGVIKNGLGTLALIKTGTGTQTLSGSNIYTGATTVGNGALNLTGYLNSSATVNSGGAVGGAGSYLGGVHVFSGGILAPGDPVTTTMSGLTLDSGANLNYDLSATSTSAGGGVNDLTQVNGNLSITNTGTLNIFSSTGGSPTTLSLGTYDLINYTGSLSGAGANVTLTNWSFTSINGPPREKFSLVTTSASNGQIDLLVALANQSSLSLTSALTYNTHVGAPGSGVGDVITNSTSTGDQSSYSLASVGGSATFSPSSGTLNAGSATVVNLGWGNVSTAGSRADTVSLTNPANPSDGSSATRTVLTGGVYNYATASVGSTVTVADAFVNSSPTSSAVNVANVSPSSYSDALDAYGHATPGLTAGSATLISGGTSNTLNVVADTSFSHTGGGSITVGLVSNGTAVGLGLTTLTPTTVAVTGGNVYDHAAIVNSAATVRLTQGQTGTMTYSVSNPLGTSSLRDAALVSNVTGSSANFTTNATGLTTFSIAANGSTVYSASYSSTSSSDPTAGNLAFQYGDLHNTLAGANNNNQTLSVAVNAIVDPIVEVNTVSTSGTLTIANTNTASDRVAAGDATTGFIGTVMPQYRAPGQYIPGVLTEANMYGATGHSEGVVEVNVLPNGSGATSALEPVTVLLFDFFNGAAETAQQSTDFSALTADLAAFGYTYSTDTTAGVLGQFDHGSLYTPVGYTYELAVNLDSGPTAGENPSQIDFNFSKYDLQVDNLLAVPEPTTMGLLGAAGLGLLSRRRPRASKRRKME